MIRTYLHCAVRLGGAALVAAVIAPSLSMTPAANASPATKPIAICGPGEHGTAVSILAGTAVIHIPARLGPNTRKRLQENERVMIRTQKRILVPLAIAKCVGKRIRPHVWMMGLEVPRFELKRLQGLKQPPLVEPVSGV